MKKSTFIGGGYYFIIIWIIIHMIEYTHYFILRLYIYSSPMKFLLTFFLGLSTYKNENGFFVAFLNFSLSTPRSEVIIFLSLEDGNS